MVGDRRAYRRRSYCCWYDGVDVMYSSIVLLMKHNRYVCSQSHSVDVFVHSVQDKGQRSRVDERDITSS